ncbi:S1/P1 nuclease [Chitinophagaceae bacterium MMS25-I14]
MTRTILTCAAVCCLLFYSRISYGWSADGHHITAEIAMHYLNDTARQNVLKILGKTTPDEAATWMDDVRSNSYYDFMKHWHYVDIPKDDSFHNNGDNIIAALNQAFNDLKNNRLDSKAKRKEAVMMLFHLMGDLHQPLHTGYPGDKGGNDVQISYHMGGTNLHHVWDDDIIGTQKITADTCIALGDKLSPEQRKALSSGSFVKWMYESRSYLPQVYDFKGNKLNDEYMEKNKELVEHQLLAGGLRLARILNILFGSTPL